MKCSGARYYRKEAQPCCRVARPEFDGFCSATHQEQARKYAGNAYDIHVAKYRDALDDSELIDLFNEEYRPVFTSIIDAGKKHARQQFMSTTGVQYASMLQSAWETVGTVATQSIERMKTAVASARQAKKSVKRIRDNDARLSAIMRKSGSDDAEASASPASPNPAPKQKFRLEVGSAEAVEYARHQPLPDAFQDDDDDLMSE